MVDAVDLITAAWREQCPDVDVAPMEVVGRITRLARVLDRELREFFTGHGLERWEFDMLATLRRSGGDQGLTPGALIKAAMITSGAVTNRIDRLESKGLVRRNSDPGDRRSVRIQLTAAGRTMVDELLPRHVANENRLLADLSAADRDHLTALLRTLSESLGDTTLT
ncbi:MarR family winged helix-turn-helix transcriptional regulator [Nocardia vaccinii]|uniref:MarR family winged helix-turn-helix transcriptional regulator n=1 Tax=Nocardia vaccinii TaxID=1822 RepID=UPI00083184D4|nr:MarR family transcriptional regulator [Nocardia vaccinii]